MKCSLHPDIPGSFTTMLSVSSESARRSAFVISNCGVPRIFLESSFAGTYGGEWGLEI